MQPADNLLIVRMDKLGDLVLSLPVDQAPVALASNVTWLISKNTGFIAEHALPPRQYFEMPKNFSWSHLKTLVSWLKQQKFSSAVVLYAPWWIGLALVLAHVRTRVGRRSRWHSYLFFNHGIRQSRKHGARHETDDNLALLQAGLDTKLTLATTVPALQLRAAQTSLEKWPLMAKNYFVVHPGMAGSSLNWPTTSYAELIQKLCQSANVVVTGTKADAGYIVPLKNILNQTAAATKIIWLNETLNSEQLLTVLSQARVVIAPSTGVLHLAASLGCATVGLYSPLPVQRPTRWGPRGPRVTTLTSPASEQEALNNPHAAMARLAVEDVLNAVHSFGPNLESDLTP